jgi:hypothetical protein
MKIRLGDLRRIIREALEEQGWVPGRWYPGDGEPVDREEVGKLGNKCDCCGLDELDGEWGNLGSCDCEKEEEPRKSWR